MRLGTLTESMDEDALWALHSCKCVLYVLDCTPDHIWWCIGVASEMTSMHGSK